MTTATFIIHQGDKMLHLRDPEVTKPNRKHFSQDSKILFGEREPVDSLCAYYYNLYEKKHRRAIRYKVRDASSVLSQVHVYIAESDALPATTSVSIPVSAISRIKNFRLASGRTSLTWLWVDILIDVVLHNNNHHTHSEHHAHTPNQHYGPRTKGRI